MTDVDPIHGMFEALGEANSAHDLGLTEEAAIKKLQRLFPSVDVARIVAARGLPPEPLGFAEETGETPIPDTGAAAESGDVDMNRLIRLKASREIDMSGDASMNDRLRAAFRRG